MELIVIVRSTEGERTCPLQSSQLNAVHLKGLHHPHIQHVLRLHVSAPLYLERFKLTLSL